METRRSLSRNLGFSISSAALKPTATRPRNWRLEFLLPTTTTTTFPPPLLRRLTRPPLLRLRCHLASSALSPACLSLQLLFTNTASNVSSSDRSPIYSHIYYFYFYSYSNRLYCFSNCLIQFIYFRHSSC